MNQKIECLNRFGLSEMNLRSVIGGRNDGASQGDPIATSTVDGCPDTSVSTDDSNGRTTSVCVTYDC